jgi:transcriptional regulator with XRE-family HTH domain
VSTRYVAESDLHELLREELAKRGWSTQHFADRLGVRFGVVSRWLSENPGKRVVPLPGMCVQIAAVLDFDVLEVFMHAGYLPVLKWEEGGGRDPDVQAVLLRLDRILTRVPADQRTLAVILAGAVLDHLQTLIDRVESFHG